MCCRVLVVDDDPRFRALAREVLELRGCRVVGEAGTGAAARSAAGRLAPDAVLLDVRLPDESGFEVCAALTDARRAPAVLLVSATDYGTCEVVALCGARGFALKSDLVAIELARYWPVTDTRPPSAGGERD
jgi:DNA-binding NarL/FixJ family response regulator